MFTVKAEVHQDIGPNHFQLFQAASVRVAKSRTNGANGPGQPAYIAPELEVELLDADRKRIDSLEVGQGLDHFSAVFVMNERGKTVEAIYPSNHLRPINVVKEIAA